jgi:MYXO-CTERM domain-containing protein
LLNSPGPAANFLNTSDYAWLLADATSTISTYTGTDQFNVDTSAFANAFTGTFAVVRGDSVLGGDDTQLYLTFASAAINNVTPEPSAFVLAAWGLAGLGLLTRRRKRRMKQRHG